MSRPWTRRLCWTALIALIAYVCVSAVVAVFLAEITLHMPRRPMVDHRFVADAIHNLHAKIRDVTMQARDGAVLRAWYVEPATPNGSSVILLHGLGDNRAGVAGYAKLFLLHGYRVLLPDSRAHGQSGGTITTYGVLERDDIRRWTEWLKSQLPGRCVFGFGESMGAALILQSLATNPPLCGVVAESPFSSFREIAYDRIGQRVGAGPRFGRTVGRLALEFALLYARARYGIDLAQADPKQALAKSNVPVLLIGDGNDTNIPPRHARMLANSAGPNVTLWIVPGAEHTGAWATEPAQFETKVVRWFDMLQPLHATLRR
jgi:pimeloyl-ACP methyl ester carboxylesterase